MTTAADDSAVEEAFEAVLAGRRVPDDATGGAAVAAFAGAVRTAADRTPRPNAALAELLATGLITDLSSPSARTASSADRPPRAARSRRRRRSMILSALLAKFLSAGALAQAATGATAVVVAVTGAGAVGVLPDPIQQTFSDVTGLGSEETTAEEPTADETTPEETSEETAPEEVLPDAGETDGETDGEAPELTAEEEWLLGPAEGESFGAWVSEGARGGFLDGQVVSREARERNEERRRREGAEPSAEPTAEPTTAEPVDETDEADAERAEDQGGRDNGNGRAGGGGNGNGGNGDGGGRGRP
jgi:hypothetical protein